MNNNHLLFSNKMTDIYYEPALKMMVTIYHGIVKYDLLEEIIDLINNTAISNGINGSLADVSELRGSYHKMLGYMKETGLPLLIENGYRVHAQIISDEDRKSVV